MINIFEYAQKQITTENEFEKKFFRGQSEKETIEFTGVNGIQTIYKKYIRIKQQNQQQPESNN